MVYNILSLNIFNFRLFEKDKKKFMRKKIFSIFIMVTFSTIAQEYPLEWYFLMGSIKDGDLYSNVSVKKLKESGNFGLGGFSSFSGELILLDGQVYKIPYDGVPIVSNNDDHATYAKFTTFFPELTFETSNISKNTWYIFYIELPNSG